MEMREIFRISVSNNSTEYQVYSGKVRVENWLFDFYCRSLSQTPVVSTVEDTSRLKVQSAALRLFYVHLESPEDYLTSMLFEKVGSMQNELSATRKELNTLRTEFEKRIDLQPKLKYAIYNSTITGTLWCSAPNTLKYPVADKYCTIPSGSWLFLDLR